MIIQNLESFEIVSDSELNDVQGGWRKGRKKGKKGFFSLALANSSADAVASGRFNVAVTYTDNDTLSAPGIAASSSNGFAGSLAFG